MITIYNNKQRDCEDIATVPYPQLSRMYKRSEELQEELKGYKGRNDLTGEEKKIRNNLYQELDATYVTVRGIVIEETTRMTMNNNVEVTMTINAVYGGNITGRLFFARYYVDNFNQSLKNHVVELQGVIKEDVYNNTYYIKTGQYDYLVSHGMVGEDFGKGKEVSEKRVEMRAKTKMGGDSLIAPDRVLSVNETVCDVVGVADKMDCHALPYLHESWKKTDKSMKVLYGIELDITSTVISTLLSTRGEFVVVDIETTGLNKDIHEIIEVACLRYRDNVLVDKYVSLVKPQNRVSSKITKVTHIQNKDVVNQRTWNVVSKEMVDFLGDSILIAHNGVAFDIPFINKKLEQVNLPILRNQVIDTLVLSRMINKNDTKHSLGMLAKKYKSPVKDFHRAENDCINTWFIYSKLVKQKTVELDNNAVIYIKRNRYSVNQNGIERCEVINAFNRMVTEYSLNRVKPDLEQLHASQDYTVGCAWDGECINSIIAGKMTDEELASVLKKKYDYLEITHSSRYVHKYRNNLLVEKTELKNVLQRIVHVAELAKIPVCMVGIPQYTVDMITNKNFLRGVDNSNGLVMSGQELMDNLTWVDDTEKKREYVYTNPKLIAEQIDNVVLYPDKGKALPPTYEGAKEKLKEIAEKKIKELYGENPASWVIDRYKEEYKLICEESDNAPIYAIAHDIIKYVENELDEMVGSRGSIGSSYLAFLTGITKCNSLPPHYLCSSCKHHELANNSNVRVGEDLPDKNCPVCGKDMLRTGYDDEIYSFLGFGRVKPADIDTNYSPDAQKIVIEKINKEHTAIRAGTVGTHGEKAIEKYVVNNIATWKWHKSYINSTNKVLEKIKQQTGKHPGGVILLPDKYDILDYSPMMYSTQNKNNQTEEQIVSYYQYDILENHIFKLDVLGKNTPRILKRLKEKTGVDPYTVDLRGTVECFRNGDVAGIAEFGTENAKKQVMKIKPTCIDDLIRVSGLLHGTGIWKGNQEVDFDCGTPIRDLICSRQDLMRMLTGAGLDYKTAYKITDKVRKGKYKTLSEEELSHLKELNLKWLMEKMEKIQYIFPKAHAYSYVVEGCQEMWYKKHHERVFYEVILSEILNNTKWDWEVMMQNDRGLLIELLAKNGAKEANEEDEFLEEEDELELEEEKKKKKENIAQLYLVLIEMLEKGYKIGKISLNRSQATDVVIDESTKTIYPPWTTLNGIQEKSATKLITKRQDYRDKHETYNDKDLIKHMFCTVEYNKNTGDIKSEKWNKRFEEYKKYIIR